MIWSLAKSASQRMLAAACWRGTEQRMCPLFSGERQRQVPDVRDNRKLFWAGWKDTAESGPALVALEASSEHLCNVWFWTCSCLWSHRGWPSQRFREVLCILLLNPSPPAGRHYLLFAAESCILVPWHTSSGSSHSVLLRLLPGSATGVDFTLSCITF